jgi:hypothetical protein
MENENETVEIWNTAYRCYDEHRVELKDLISNMMQLEMDVLTSMMCDNCDTATVVFRSANAVEGIMAQAMRDGVDIDELQVDNFNNADKEGGIFTVVIELSFPKKMIRALTTVVKHLEIYIDARDAIDSMSEDTVGNKGDERVIDLVTGETKTGHEIAKDRDVDVREILFDAEQTKMKVECGLVLGEVLH